jgi:hypothetical protein
VLGRAVRCIPSSTGLVQGGSLLSPGSSSFGARFCLWVLALPLTENSLTACALGVAFTPLRMLAPSPRRRHPRTSVYPGLRASLSLAGREWIHCQLARTKIH